MFFRFTLFDVFSNALKDHRPSGSLRIRSLFFSIIEFVDHGVIPRPPCFPSCSKRVAPPPSVCVLFSLIFPFPLTRPPHRPRPSSLPVSRAVYRYASRSSLWRPPSFHLALFPCGARRLAFFLRMTGLPLTRDELVVWCLTHHFLF